MPRVKSSTLRERAEHRWGPQYRWRCVYCGRSIPDGHVDHFVPRERGGTDLYWNLVPACGPCNRSKSDHDPLVWMRAVGVPEETIASLQLLTRSPRWTRADGFTFRARTLDYHWNYSTVGAWLRDEAPVLILPLDLSDVFVLDAPAWSPVTAIRRVATDYLTRAPGWPSISAQQLNRELESRGLARTKRKGVYGYQGIRVDDAPAPPAAGPKATRASRALVKQRAQLRAGFPPAIVVKRHIDPS